MLALGQEVDSLEPLTCIFPYKGYVFAQARNVAPPAADPFILPRQGRVLWALVLLLPRSVPDPFWLRRGGLKRQLSSFLLLFFGRETLKQTNEKH